jgi:uncharacterized delta-60 repeat protein
MKILKLFLATVLIFSQNLIAQPGAIDPMFNPSDVGFGFGDGANSTVYCSSLQTDGKLVIGGAFTKYNNSSTNCITRVNTDGTIDDDFNPGTGANYTIRSISIQNDSKIVIGGDFTAINGVSRNGIARLNSDGSLDASFVPGSGGGSVYATAIQADGKILIGGTFITYNGTTLNRIARLNTDGSLDNTFLGGTGASYTVNTINVQADGKIIIGGEFTSFDGTSINRIARLNSDGTLDATFNVGTGADGSINSSVLQSDGKLIIAGSFQDFNGTSLGKIARLNTDGSVDTGFNPGSGASSYVNTISVQSDGKIIVAGYFSFFAGVSKNYIARLNSNGTLDGTFVCGTGGINPAVLTSLIQTDGKIVIGGLFTTYNGITKSGLARINSDGSIDSGFNTGSGANNNEVLSSALQSDGKILIGGSFRKYNSKERNCLSRINDDGSLDSNFVVGTGLYNNFNPYFVSVKTISIQTDGKIIIGGDFGSYNGATSVNIARLNTDGTLDGTFVTGAGTTGGGAFSTVYASAIQSDGKIIIAGEFSAYNGTNIKRIARLKSDGTLDTTFKPGTGPNSTIISLGIQSDGKILIGGYFTTYNGTAINYFARLNADGSLDGTFTVGTGAGGQVNSIAVQSDGKIVIAGYFFSYNSVARYFIARINSDGTLDNTFNNPGTGPNGQINSASINSDGKVIVGGNFTTYNGTSKKYLARLNSDGTLDATFNIGSGASDFVYTTAIQPDEKIIIGGKFTSYNGTGRNRVARLFTVACTPPSILSVTPNSGCNGDAINLEATASSGIINWYAASTGGAILGSGTTFITPSLTGTTVYYVDATDASCTSARTAVTATINSIDTSTSLSSATITSNQNGASYEWADCNNSMLLIGGENGQSYTPATDGDYAVIITLNGCKDTSSCINVIVSGIFQVSNTEILEVYPNPANGRFTVRTSQVAENISIVNELGQIIYSLNPTSNSSEINPGLPSGIYFIKVRNQDKISTMKLLIQNY